MTAPPALANFTASHWRKFDGNYQIWIKLYVDDYLLQYKEDLVSYSNGELQYVSTQ
jgi:hypothetical protein